MNQQNILDALEALQAADAVSDVPSIGSLYWLHNFLEDVTGNATQVLPEDEFYPSFASWLGTSGVSYLADMSCIDVSTGQSADCFDIVGAFDSPPAEGANANIRLRVVRGAYYLQDLAENGDFVDAIRETRRQLDPVVDRYSNANDTAYETFAIGYVHMIWEQYLTYLGQILTGDFGTSIMTTRPVTEDILRFFPATLELATLATLIGCVIGIPLGVWAAVNQGRWIDHCARVLGLAGYSAPVFWLGMLGLLIFYGNLGWVAGPGRIDIYYDGLVEDPTGVILFDAAYEAFIQDPSLPHSIFEIEGARDCAIEFRSFSKNAGFTGTRCALTVVPKGLRGKTSNGEKVELWGLWNRRQSTKFNGVSYIIQRGAEAVYSEAGQREVKALVSFYMENAAIIRRELSAAGLSVYGGEHAPYVWIKTPDGMDSWGFFDHLLNQANVVGTPGSGFGAAGEGYFRLSAFNSRNNVDTAMARIKAL